MTDNKKSPLSRGARRVLSLNKHFKAPIHPFNLQNDGVKTYAEWQFERGADTVKFFTSVYDEKELFFEKKVLDMGCGAGGKSLYYASRGALHVVGVDIVERYKAEAEALADKVGLRDKFTFVCASAYELPYPDASFDTIIMNDFMEHVDNPERALKEGVRLLTPGGRLLVNFPPYYHPWGAHLSDAVYIPWAHMLFSEKSLIEAYKYAVEGLPDGKERIEFRFSKREDGSEYISYINRMTLKRFKKILKESGIKPDYYREVPLRGFLKPLAVLPGIKEMFVKMAVCCLKKPE